MIRNRRNKDGSYSVTGKFMGRRLVAEGKTVPEARTAYLHLMVDTQNRNSQEAQANVKH